jgi:hypothetical protein
MKFLQTADPVLDTVRIPSGLKLPPLNRVAAFFCSHFSKDSFRRTDHRGGPGGFADNFEGTFCMACGRILNETLTDVTDMKEPSVWLVDASLTKPSPM